MQLSIVAVGRVRAGPMRTLLDDYLGRIQRYAKCTEVEVREQPERGFEERFRKARDGKARAILLDVEGRAPSSERFADMIGRARDDGDHLQFLIGGSYGLPEVLRENVHSRLSLSDMTLPHQLARLMLAEQLYRGFTILRGEPYSH